MNLAFLPLVFLMRRPAYGKQLQAQHTGRAASRREKPPPTRSRRQSEGSHACVGCPNALAAMEETNEEEQ